MTDTLSNKEIAQLIACGKAIQEDLMCDANGTGLPCRTDRLSAVESMIEYLEIHGMKVIRDTEIWVAPSKSEKEEGKTSNCQNRKAPNEKEIYSFNGRILCSIFLDISFVLC